MTSHNGGGEFKPLFIHDSATEIAGPSTVIFVTRTRVVTKYWLGDLIIYDRLTPKPERKPRWLPVELNPWLAYIPITRARCTIRIISYIKRTKRLENTFVRDGHKLIQQTRTIISTKIGIQT